MKVLICVLLLIPLSTMASPFACFWRDHQYRGQKICLKAGNWNLINMGWDNDIDSYKIPAGLKVKICKRPNCLD